MVPAARRSSVSTASLPVSERLAYWEHYNASALVGLTCQTFAEEGLVARETNLDLDRFRVADIAGNAHVIERPQRLVRSHPKSSAFVSLLTDGEGYFHQGHQWLRMGAGDVIVYDTDRPYLFGFGPATATRSTSRRRSSCAATGWARRRPALGDCGERCASWSSRQPPARPSKRQTRCSRQ